MYIFHSLDSVFHLLTFPQNSSIGELFSPVLQWEKQGPGWLTNLNKVMDQGPLALYFMFFTLVNLLVWLSLLMYFSVEVIVLQVQNNFFDIALPFASKHFWITLNSCRPKNKNNNKKNHLRYLTPCKCQNFIALDTNHFRASRPKINSCNVFCRKGYDISYKTE